MRTVPVAASRVMLTALLLLAGCAPPGPLEAQVPSMAEVLEHNLRATDFTGLVSVLAADVRPPDGNVRGNDEGDVNVVAYSARVLESYRGDEREHIVYLEYADAEEGLEQRSFGRLIVSVCEDDDGTYYLPGIGYELPAEPGLIERARAWQRTDGASGVESDCR